MCLQFCRGEFLSDVWDEERESGRGDERDDMTMQSKRDTSRTLCK